MQVVALLVHNNLDNGLEFLVGTEVQASDVGNLDTVRWYLEDTVVLVLVVVLVDNNLDNHLNEQIRKSQFYE